MNGDLAEHLGEKQVSRIRKMVQDADYTKCEIAPVRKEVDTFVIDCLFYLIKQHRSPRTWRDVGMGAAQQSPLAAAILAALAVYGRVHGWF